jgi:hypothetical protein
MLLEHTFTGGAAAWTAPGGVEPPGVDRVALPDDQRLPAFVAERRLAFGVADEWEKRFQAQSVTVSGIAVTAGFSVASNLTTPGVITL